MRKFVFILLILVSVTEASAKVFIKAFGGFNLSRYSGEIGNDIWKFRTGYEAGIGFEIDLSSHIAIEIDEYFIQSGSRREVRDVDGSYAYTLNYTLSGINIPILLKVRLRAGSSPYILVGGEVFLISSYKWKVKERYEFYTIYPEINSVCPGLVFGCGFEWKKEKISLFVEAMYQLDMTAIFESTYAIIGDIWQSPVWKPRAIVFLIGLKQKIL